MDDRSDDPRAQVEATVARYLAGAAGARGVLRDAFYSSCNLHSTDAQGRLEIVALDRFIAFAEAGLLPDHESEVLALDVVGDIASAKVRFTFDSYAFVDFLALVRLPVGWRIVSKVYTTIDA